jgi:CDP-diglyceride synthetase
MLVSVFIRAGLDKFDDGSGWARAFAVWGYPTWFRVLIGTVELSAAILILWPRTAAYAAILIILVMLGGMGTHIVIERRPARATSEAGQLVFSSIVLAGRWRRRIPILRR